MRHDVLEFLLSMGLQPPTREALNACSAHISPALGYDLHGRRQRSMPELCGHEAKPTYLAWQKPRFLSLPCLEVCLSFVTSPELMCVYCAVARKMAATCSRKSCWEGTVVDAAGRKPHGLLARSHFKLWSLAKAVVACGWEAHSVAFLCGAYHVWKFLELREPDLLLSRSSVPSRNVRLLLNVRGAVRGKVVVGLAAGADRNAGIVDALNGKPSPGTVVVALSVSGSRGKHCFQFNGARFGPKAAPIKRFPGVLLEFSLGRSEVRARIGADRLAASLPQDLGGTQDFYCFVVGLGLEAVKPCWCLARD